MEIETQRLLIRDVKLEDKIPFAQNYSLKNNRLQHFHMS